MSPSGQPRSPQWALSCPLGAGSTGQSDQCPAGSMTPPPLSAHTLGCRALRTSAPRIWKGVSTPFLDRPTSFLYGYPLLLCYCVPTQSLQRSRLIKMAGQIYGCRFTHGSQDMWAKLGALSRTPVLKEIPNFVATVKVFLRPWIALPGHNLLFKKCADV